MASGRGVKVGKGVGLGISVGGWGVAVGIAIWVAATMVQAAETAVPCTSAGDGVGVPCGPQAVINNASPIRTGNIRLSIFLSISLLLALSLLLLYFNTILVNCDDNFALFAKAKISDHLDAADPGNIGIPSGRPTGVHSFWHRIFKDGIISILGRALQRDVRFSFRFVYQHDFPGRQIGR
jgi:hypothetical protein